MIHVGIINVAFLPKSTTNTITITFLLLIDFTCVQVDSTPTVFTMHEKSAIALIFGQNKCVKGLRL